MSMNNLVREHFGPRGVPKRPFASPEDAAAFRNATKGQKRKRVYQCSVCGAWHIGARRKGALSGRSDGSEGAGS